MPINRNVDCGENPGTVAAVGGCCLVGPIGAKTGPFHQTPLLLLLRRTIFDDGAKRGPDVRLIVGNPLPYITLRRRVAVFVHLWFVV